MIQFGIVEDIENIREMLRLYFSSQEGFQVSFAAESAAEIPMHKIDDLDILLCDIGLPGKSGMEITWKLKQKKPTLQIVMFTVSEDEENIFQAMQAGASGYLLKETSLPVLKKSMLSVLDGGAAISPMIAKKIIDYFKPSKKPLDLTDREEEVLKFIREGFSNKQVAEKLCISLNTVKFHIKNCYTKLQVNSRMELLNFYKKR